MAQRIFRSSDTASWANRYSNGSDGNLTISSPTTDSTAKTSASGTSGTTTLTVGSASGFADGNLILIYQSRNGGDGVGYFELNSISSGGATTTWTLASSLTHNFDTTAQVYLLKQYANVTINAALTGSSWDGSSGGVLPILANGTVNGSGSIILTGTGYRNNVLTGGVAQGEGSSGSPTYTTAANGNGAGGGQNAPDSGHVEAGHGGGGGNGTTGSTAGTRNTATGGSGGSTAGNSDLSIAVFGGAGGYGGTGLGSGSARAGGAGAGVLIIIAPNIDLSSMSSVTLAGNNGTDSNDRGGAGGAGAGGSALLQGNIINIGTNKITALGGTGGTCTGTFGGSGGSAGNGRVYVRYGTSLTGTSNPSLTSDQDSLLLVTQTKDNSPKANIKAVTRQDNSSVANILKINNTQNNSAKANLILVRGIKDNYVLANFRYSHYEKKYDYRVYDGATGAYISSWSSEVISEPGFRTIINGGPGELVVKLKRTFDDFGEGDDITLNNRVELWCADRDNPSGIMIYAGSISGYRPVLAGQNEYIEVTLLHDIAQFAQIILRNADGSTDVNELTKDPSTIFRDIIDLYRNDNGKVFYTATSIDNTNTSVSYDFTTYSVKDSVDKAIELSPDKWYWRVDPDNTFHFHTSNFAASDHAFYIGKHIIKMETWRRAEDIVNRIYFVGGGSPSLYRVYSNNGSISSYGIRAITYVDQRVTLTATADTIANRILDQKKDPEIRTTITIVDNNGLDANKGYDIESVKVGQTLRILGLKPAARTTSLWDIFEWDTDVWDQTLAAAATDILQVQSVSYDPNMITVEASSRLPIIAKRIEDVNRNLVQSQTDNTPASPTIVP